MKTSDFIVRFENLFSYSLIDRIVNYMNSEDLEDMGIGGGVTTRLDKNIRKVEGFSVHNIFPMCKENATKWIFFKLIAQQLNIIHLNYLMMTTRDPSVMPNVLHQVDFLKYSKDGKYDVHIDGGSLWRNLTTIVNLSDDYEGGEFLFFDPTKKQIIKEEKLKKGTVICFPSNFLYPHSVKPITRGERFSLACWTQ